jgi:hypothetical protein
VTKPTGWKPPEGDPVARFMAAKTPKEKSDLISNFMALGHDRNPVMLLQAFYDPSFEVRRTAVESVTALTDEESGKLLPHVVANDMKDIRDMGWDILSRHPAEVRNAAYRYVIMEGPEDAFKEAFDEMFGNPQRVVFEGMLDISIQAPTGRQERLLQEVHKWLREPSGSPDVPDFATVKDAAVWWGKNKAKFDEWMLRID